MGMELSLTITLSAACSDLCYYNREYFLPLQNHITDFICAARTVHEMAKARIGSIFICQIKDADLLRFIRFKWFSHVLDLIVFVLVWLLVIMIQVQALILI